jgi:hypothetical protein
MSTLPDWVTEPAYTCVVAGCHNRVGSAGGYCEEHITVAVRNEALRYWATGKRQTEITEIILTHQGGDEWLARVTWTTPDMDADMPRSDMLYTVTLNAVGELDIFGPTW